MEHSITFSGSQGTIHTWDDFRMVPSTRPIFQPPALKSKLLDIPGRDGKLDISSAIRGFPVFQNSKGSFEFIVLNSHYGDNFNYQDPEDIKEQLLTFFKQGTVQATLDDDPNYTRQGIFGINEWTNCSDYPKIKIDYEVYPYKRAKTYTTISKAVSSTAKGYSLTSTDYGDEPVQPSFIIPSGVKVKVEYRNGNMNSYKNLGTFSAGTHKIPGLVLFGSIVYLRLTATQGSGSIQLKFRKGFF